MNTKKLTKIEIGFKIGSKQPFHAGAIYWNHYTRPELVKMYNKIFINDQIQ